MKRILLSLACCVAAWSLSAQDYSLHLMPEVWNSSYTNPGLFPRQTVVVSLPSVHTSVNSLGLGRASLLRYNADKDNYQLDYAGVLASIDQDVTMRYSTVVDAMAVGVRANRWFFSASTQVCADGYATAPRDLLNLAWNGTVGNMDRTQEIGPVFNSMAYQKIGIGVNYAATNRLSVGLRVHRLMGIASFQTERSSLQLTQSSEYYQTTVQADIAANYYAAGSMMPVDLQGRGLANISEDLDGGEQMSEGIFNQNNGFALDMGAEYFVNPRLALTASVLNLGSINWENGTQRVELTENYTYEGIEVDLLGNSAEVDFEQVRDTFENLISYEAVADYGYRQRLAPRTYLGARYQANRYLTVGGLWFNEMTDYGTFMALSASARLTLGRVFSLGGIYTLQRNTRNNLGLNAALNLGPVQLYGIADNITPFFRPEAIDATNFRLGLNLVFGQKKMEGLLANRLDPAAAGEVVASQPVPTGEPVPAQRNQQKNQSTTPDPAPDERVASAERTKKAKSASRRARKQSSAPSASQLSSGLPAAQMQAYELTTNFRDQLTTQALGVVYVDVYRVDDGGHKSLVRTGRFEEGKVQMLLNYSEAEHELLVRAHGYEPTTLTLVPMPGAVVEGEQYLSPSPEAIEEVAVVPSEPEPVPAVAAEPNGQPGTVIEEAPMQAEEALVEEIEEVIAEVEPATAPAEATVPPTAPVIAPPASRAAPSSRPAKPRYYERPQEYFVTQRTSLRSHPTSDSDVLRRLAVGQELQVLEKTYDFWWMVSVNGREGWVKARLLEGM